MIKINCDIVTSITFNKIYLIIMLSQSKISFIQINWMKCRALIFKYINFYSTFLQMQGKRTLESKGQQIIEHSKLGGNFVQKPNPEYLAERMKMFTEIKLNIDKVLAEVQKTEITIRLKDGKQIKGSAFVTTPYMIAKSISKNLAESSIVARVKYSKKVESPFGKGVVSAELDDQHQKQFQELSAEYELVDMGRALEGDCLLELVNFEDKLGKQVFWHSSAHLLGQSLENIYGAWLCHGPPLQHGFFYDSFIGDLKISQADYEKIEKSIQKFIQQKQPYERILLTKKEALEMFAYNPFKVQLIKAKIPEDGYTSAYRCGNLIDLCTGPHLISADKVKGFKVMKNSSAYWLGNKQNDDLQRVYGISYPKQSMLDEYLKQQEELAKRDHRNIGPKQKLFNFTQLSPGSAIFYPRGAIVYNKLMDLMKQEYKIRGYSQVLSPNIYNTELWKMSGHYFKYKQNIFFIKQESGEEHGLKPMNCPGHCIMFDMIQRSYRDLPIRFAEFGVLHRNQLKGALSGLTRVRRFQQDDAHIFCMVEQLEVEIIGVLDLLDYIYSIFGFKYVLELSTRPEKFLGLVEDWNIAQESLRNALDKFGRPYKINQGDGAFYGPKIDVKLFDIFEREHQCGTIQLDFQLPIRFNLQFRGKEVKEEQQPEILEQSEGHSVSSKGSKKEKIHLTQQEIEQRKKQKAERKKKKDQKAQEKPQQQVQKQQEPVQKKEQTMEEMQERYSKIGHLKKGFVRPVIIHRAIFGSLQRFIAILCEHTGGKWDFWVSPRQIKLIPMNADSEEFTQLIFNTLLLKGYAASTDRSGDNFNKKIRNAQVKGYNFIGVIGKKQVENKTVNLRKRDEQKEIGQFSVVELLKLFESLNPPKSKKREDLEKMSLL